MFESICILTALYLYANSAEYRDISFSVLCFFVISDVVFNYILLDFRAENNWLIYQFYNVINIFIVLSLAKNKAHLVILGVIIANILLNIVVSLYFISSWGRWVYDMYKYVAGFLMVLALCYMWVISYGIRFLDRPNCHRNLFDMVFRLRYGIHHKNIL